MCFQHPDPTQADCEVPEEAMDEDEMPLWSAGDAAAAGHSLTDGGASASATIAAAPAAAAQAAAPARAQAAAPARAQAAAPARAHTAAPAPAAPPPAAPATAAPVSLPLSTASASVAGEHKAHPIVLDEDDDDDDDEEEDDDDDDDDDEEEEENGDVGGTDAARGGPARSAEGSHAVHPIVLDESDDDNDDVEAQGVEAESDGEGREAMEASDDATMRVVEAAATRIAVAAATGTAEAAATRMAEAETETYLSLALGVVSRALAAACAEHEVALRCGICWDSIRKPTATPCRHVFCRACIRYAMYHRKECPTCRTPIASHRALLDDGMSAALFAEQVGGEARGVSGLSGEARAVSGGARAVSGGARGVSGGALKEEVRAEDDNEEEGIATEAGGLKLHLSSRGATTGYLGVYPCRGGFKAKFRTATEKVTIGLFDTAVEAAIAFARYVQSRGGGEQTAAATEAAGPSSTNSKRPCSAADAPRKRRSIDGDGDAATAAGRQQRQEEEEEGEEGGEGEREEEEDEGEEGGESEEESEMEEAARPIRTTCPCGYTCKHAAGLASHMRSCDAASSSLAEEGDRRVTEAEGFRLHHSSTNRTGYRGVSFNGERSMFTVMHYGGGKSTWLGYYRTAVEGAVAYARHAKRLSDQAAGDAMDVEWRENGREEGHKWLGRPVRRFHGEAIVDGVVRRWLPPGQKSDDVALWRVEHADGDVEDLEQHEMRASLDAYSEGRTHAASAGEAERHIPTEAEGFRLHTSNRSQTGYRGVYRTGTRFYALSRRVFIGTYGSPVEAAVGYARFVQSLGNAHRKPDEKAAGAASSSAAPATSAAPDAATPDAATPDAAPADAAPVDGAQAGDARWTEAMGAEETSGMQEVAAALAAARLDAYAEKMDEVGYDDVDFLRSLAADRHAFANVMTDHVGMKLGHAMRFAHVLRGEVA